MFNIKKPTIMTKTVLNRLVVLVSVMVLGLASKAQTAQFLIVTQQDDTQAGFALSEQPVVNCTDGMLKVASPSQTLEVELNNVKNYAFAETFQPTAIDQIKEDVKPVIRIGMAQFENLKPGTNINIYTIDGRAAGKAVANNNGSVNIDLTTLGAGIFILVTPTASYKIYNQ